MILIEGALALKAALQGKNRQIAAVYIDQKKDSRDIDYILGLCSRSGVRVERVSPETIALQAKGKTHGGILAVASERRYQSVEELAKIPSGWLLLIEGVEDPFNLGQMIRTAYAAGASGILLSARDWSSAEATLLKSSAGAYDRIAIALLADPQKDLAHFKAQGYQLAIGYRDDTSLDYRDYGYPDPMILAVGGELRGLSKPVIAAADAKIVIRYPNEAKVALNAVSACAVLCFEITRKRSA